MTDLLNINGIVATEPKFITTSEGLNITSFRFASSQRRYNKQQDKWVEGETNWYTVTAFRQLAVNISNSIKKGNPIIITGRLKIRPWQSETKSGVSVEIEADNIGHDLNWGVSNFEKSNYFSSEGENSDMKESDSIKNISTSIPVEATKSKW